MLETILQITVPITYFGGFLSTVRLVSRSMRRNQLDQYEIEKKERPYMSKPGTEDAIMGSVVIGLIWPVGLPAYLMTRGIQDE